MDSKTAALVAKARKHEAAAKQLRKAAKEVERKEREAEREAVAELFEVLLTPGYRDAWLARSEEQRAEVVQQFADHLLVAWKKQQAASRASDVSLSSRSVSPPVSPAGTPPATH